MNTNDIATENGTRALQAMPEGTGVRRTGGDYGNAVAIQRPRVLHIVQRRLDEEAALAGERFYYGWGAGGNRIEGPSIKLATAAARCYGNCQIQPENVQDLPDSWIFTASFIDLETGFIMGRQFRMSKNYPVHGKHDNERKDDIRFQIGQSKAVRNVILNAIPQGLIDSAMDAAKAGVRKKIQQFIERTDQQEGAGKGIVKAVDYAFNGLLKHGITEAAIFSKLGIAARKAVTVDHLVVLRGDMTALDDGEARPEDLYPPTNTDSLTARMATGRGNQTPSTPDPIAELVMDFREAKSKAEWDVAEKKRLALWQNLGDSGRITAKAAANEASERLAKGSDG